LISSKIESKYLIGATKLDEKIIVLLNLDMLIPEYDKEVVVHSRKTRKKITTNNISFENNSANLGTHQKGNVDAYLVFRLNEHYFAVPEEQVNQILYLRKFNKIPGAKKNVIGVIDVRGKITTLLDLKRILNLKSPDQSQNKGNVILLNVAEDNIGMLVDQAIGLKYIAKNKIKRKLGLISSKIESKYLIGAQRNSMKRLLYY
jgi:purine-binding chemotaxis protein CheW